MEYLKFGTYAGLLLAIATIVGGVVGFVLALVFAAVGGAVGAQLGGLIDVRAIIGSGGRGRR